MALATNTILDAVTQRIHDNTDQMRTRFLTWFNDIAQMLWLEKDWKFLKTTSSDAISSDKFTLPSDYARLLDISVANTWFLDKNSQLTDEEVYEYTISDTTGSTPYGWYEDSTYIYLIPGGSGTATLRYIPVLDVYADNETTVFPERFRPVFIRSLLDAYYEFESDQRGLVSIQINQGELNRLLAWENKNNPKPKRSKYLFDSRNQLTSNEII